MNPYLRWVAAARYKPMRQWILTSVLLLSLLRSSEAQVQHYNRNDPLLRGLVGWYIGRPGFSNSSRWYNVLGRFHGTLTNGASWVASSRLNSFYDVRFDGSDDYVSIAATPVLEPPIRTITLWMKANAGGGGYQALVAYQSNTDYFNIFYRPSPQNNLAIYFKTTSADNSLDTSASKSFVAGTWLHVAIIGGAGTFATYSNCVLNESMSATGTIVASGAETLISAKGAIPAEVFGGTLSDIRIYNRIVPPAELCQIMRQSPQQMFPVASLTALLSSIIAPSGLLPFFPQGAQ